MNFNIQEWKKKFDLVFLYKEHYPLIVVDLYYEATNKYKKVIGNHHKNFIFLSTKNNVAAYYSNKESQGSREMALNFLKNDFFNKHFKNSQLSRDKYEVFRKRLQMIESIKHLSKAQIYELFNEYSKVYMELVAYFRSSRPEFSDYFIELLKEELIKLKWSKFKLEKSIYYLTTPFNANPINEEQKDWYLLLKQKSVGKKMLFQHLEKYPWLFTNTYSKKRAFNFLSLKYNVDKKNYKKIEADLGAFEKQKKRAIKYRNDLFKDKRLNHLKKLSLIIQRQAAERLLIKTSLMGIDYVAKDLLKGISDLSKLSVRHLVESYMLGDVRSLLLKNKVLNLKKVNDRQAGYIYVVRDLKKIFLSGIKAEGLINQFTKNTFREDIKGFVAYKGLIKGRVKIINTKDAKTLSESMVNFRKGDVLVATMTQPNIISIINKASAIITDQGGIISHAAIISREMKIPCIVGAKVATQVLRNGDLVEVDANKGMVRILKRA
jgi:phosphoenolpyruvate synthase/pyruvate phosphate dikinase